MAPAALRRNYTGVFNALARIVKEEGLLSLWRGTAPTVVRAMMLNSALLSTADQMKVGALQHCATLSSQPVQRLL